MNSTNDRDEKEMSPSKLIRLAQKCNCFYFGPYLRSEYKPLYFRDQQIGLIRPIVEEEIKQYSDVFEIFSDKVQLVHDDNRKDEASIKIDKVLQDIRNKPSSKLIALKGWRNEKYEVKASFSDPVPLLRIERSAACLFGLRQYGVDVNGYVKDSKKGLCLWLQRRSKSKPTWPGMWDNFVSGGLSEGLGIQERAIMESYEEANVPSSIAKNMVSKGCVTFFFENERGLFPQTEFIFDLELSSDFVPSGNDGEVEEFELLTVDEVLLRIFSSDMKTTSCPVVIDFLIRHGYINSNTEANLPELVELLHVPLHSLYKNGKNMSNI